MRDEDVNVVDHEEEEGPMHNGKDIRISSSPLKSPRKPGEYPAKGQPAPAAVVSLSVEK